METQIREQAGDNDPRQSASTDHPWLDMKSEDDSIDEAIRSSLDEIRIA